MKLFCNSPMVCCEGLIGFLTAVEKHAWRQALNSVRDLAQIDLEAEAPYTELVTSIEGNMAKAKAFNISTNVTGQDFHFDSVVAIRFACFCVSNELCGFVCQGVFRTLQHAGSPRSARSCAMTMQ